MNSQGAGPGTSIAYSYNANGNLVTRTVTTGMTSTWTYAWDAANILVRVQADGVTKGVYAYDGLGRRVESAEDATVFYAYGGTETLYELRPGTSSSDFIRAAGMLVARVAGTAVNYFHTDHLGSTRLVTSSTVLFSGNYQPFGQDNGTPSGSETYKFTGKPGRVHIRGGAGGI